MRLENKKAIVFGAAQGMGGTITETVAGEGADLVLIVSEPSLSAKHDLLRACEEALKA